MTIQAEIQKLQPSAYVEMFEVDLTALGDTVYRFHAGTNALTQPVTWQGQVYQPWPAQATGFDYNVSGQIPRPKLTLANTSGTITALVLLLNDCVGGKVTRKRTLAKFLDAVNFADGNPSADPDAHLPDEVFFIDRKASETKDAVDFELTAAFDVTGVQLPRRQIIQNLCPWKYRSAECGYTGPPVADPADDTLSFSDTGTALESAFLTARNALNDAAQTVVTARAVYNQKLQVYEESSQAVVRLSTNYSRVVPTYYVSVVRSTGETTAIFNGVRVTLGATYRQGEPRSLSLSIQYFEIEVWGIDTVAVAAALAAKNAALANLNAAQSGLATAQATYNTARNNLEDDPDYTSGLLYSRDVCGKRLNSCQLRFGSNAALPFGGFPGAGTL